MANNLSQFLPAGLDQEVLQLEIWKIQLWGHQIAYGRVLTLEGNKILVFRWCS